MPIDGCLSVETNEYFGNIPRHAALMNESGGDNYFIHVSPLVTVVLTS
jgi:hypothetical protein